ncbi:MAG: hypothetical protein ACRDT6_06265 [Micromonosporaceae bacterium]
MSGTVLAILQESDNSGIGRLVLLLLGAAGLGLCLVTKLLVGRRRR